MWGTQVPGVPSPERKARGQRYHLLQAAAKEIWHEQKYADGGDSRLQVLIPGRGINKSAVRSRAKPEEGEEAPTTSETAPASDPTTT